jgi:hypothetical protein
MQLQTKYEGRNIFECYLLKAHVESLMNQAEKIKRVYKFGDLKPQKSTDFLICCQFEIVFQ